MKPADVYFGRVLNNMPQPYRSSAAYIALSDFYGTSVKPVLELRHDIVHHYGLKSEHRWLHVEHFHDPGKLGADYQVKYNYRDELRDQLLYCLKGYVLALDLIRELPSKVVPVVTEEESGNS
jgi:hypothetical protein